jgi:hypothetical protein
VNDWTVTWDAPAEPVTGWKVQYTPKGGILTAVDVPANMLQYDSAVEMGVTGDTVQVWVRAKNAAGESPASSATAVVP